MAHAIIEGASIEGVETKLISIRDSDLTEVATEVLDAAAVVFGSATLNMGMMPMMGAVLTYLKGLRPMNKIGFAFGSYGWGKGATEAIEEDLKAMNFSLIREPLKSQWRPSEQILEECFQTGKILAEKVL